MSEVEDISLAFLWSAAVVAAIRLWWLHMNLSRYITKQIFCRVTAFPVMLIILVAFAGCATSNPRLAEMQRIKQELSSPLHINKLPLTVKLEVDEKTRNWIAGKFAVTAVIGGAGMTISLPAGEQLLVGAREVSQLIFQNVQPDGPNYDALLNIRLVDFQFSWGKGGAADAVSWWVDYSINMAVEADLVKRDGSIIYKKLLKLNHSGADKTDPTSAFSVTFAPPIMRGTNLLVGLWVRELANDITKDPKVLQFAREVGGSSTQVAEIPGPKIAVTSLTDNSSTDKGEIQLAGSISSESPIKNIQTSINGRPLEATNIPADSTSLPLNQKIPLMLGENVISITATNKAGGTSQEVIKIVRTEPKMVTSASSSKVGERWAVVVGISEYKHSSKGIPNLMEADDDAKAFADFLKSDQGGGFKDENLLLLVNEQATSTALRHGLFTFLKKAIEEDLVYFFFSGQGAPEPDNPENYYLLTHDADPDTLPTTAIATWDVDTAFKRNIKAKRSVLFVDASHVSAIGKDTETRDVTVTSTNLINKYLHQLSESGEGMAIFTASNEGQLSTDPGARKKTGLFTHYLMEALSGEGDANNDGIVTLGEAIDYTTDFVATASRGKQRPDIAGKFDRNLPLAIIR